MKQETGHLGNLTPQQEHTLQEFKKNIPSLPPRYDDYYFLRFLRARQFKLQEALEMFHNYLQWRQEVDADSAISFEFPEANEIKKFYPQCYHKTDRQGRPIYIERLGQLDLDKLFQITSEERLFRYFVREYEKLVSKVFPSCSKAAGFKVETNLSILDLSGVSMKLMNKKTINMVKATSKICQDYYPEILGEMLIVNCPRLFSMGWNTVKGFLNEKTRSKIHILGSDYSKALFERVDPENVPEFLGGNCRCPEGCINQNAGPWNDFEEPSEHILEVNSLSSEEEVEEVEIGIHDLKEKDMQRVLEVLEFKKQNLKL